MEIQTCSPSHFKGNTGLSNPLHFKTSAEEALQAQPVPTRPLYSDAERGAKDGSSGRDRARSQGSRFRVSPVFGRETRRNISPSAQPQSAQQVSRCGKVPVDQHVQGVCLSAAQRLDDEDRPEPGVFSCSNSRIPPTLSKVCSTRQSSSLQHFNCVANDESSVWPSECPENLRHALKLGGTAVALKGNKSSRLPRRLPPGESISSQAAGTDMPCQGPAPRTGLGNKHREIVIEAGSGSRISRYRVEHTRELQGTPRQETFKNSGMSGQIDGGVNLVSVGAPESSGMVELCQLHSPIRQDQLPRSVVTNAESSTRGNFRRAHCSSPSRPTVVETPLSRGKRNLASTPVSLHSDRCIRSRLGRIRGRLSPAGFMARSGTPVQSQQEGTPSHLVRITGNGSKVCGQVNPNTKRQSDGPSVPPKPRRDSLNTIIRHSQDHLQLLDDSSYPSHYELYSRSTQFCSRQSVKVQSPSRMASSAGSLRSDFSQMGRASNRFVCFTERSRRSPLRNERSEGPTSVLPRRVQQDLEVQTGMDISSAMPHASGTIRTQSGEGQIHGGLSSLAERVLESGSQNESAVPALHNLQPAQSVERHHHGSTASTSGQPSIRGMADSGWDDLLQEWSPSQRSLIESSWRPSTLRTYKQSWSKWIMWCRSTSTDVKKPGPDGIARYLIYLHRTMGLSYKTILVHKSVVTNFCKPQDAVILSSHTLVRQALKGIANETCSKTKTNKPPIWNPQLVVDWLLRNSPKPDNLFDVSRRCATLLLLASGRRVHDLTLLSMAPDYMDDQDNHITFWPMFGSKTDSLTRRQSGWQLSPCSHHNIDLVFWLRKLLEISAPRRALANTTNLFITTRGTPQAASRTVIGGWVRTVLRDAGIQESAGSTRSAVASLNWVEQYPIEEILARGNWASENTLIRFYKRQIAQPLINTVSMATCFKPV